MLDGPRSLHKRNWLGSEMIGRFTSAYKSSTYLKHNIREIQWHSLDNFIIIQYKKYSITKQYFEYRLRLAVKF